MNTSLHRRGSVFSRQEFIAFSVNPTETPQEKKQYHMQVAIRWKPWPKHTCASFPRYKNWLRDL